MASWVLTASIIVVGSIAVWASTIACAGEDDRPLSLAPQIGEIVPRASRDVTPPGMTPGPAVTGPLVRVPSPVPKKPRPKPQPRRQRLYNPEVVSAGSILTAAGPVSIAHVEAPGIDAVCGDGSAAWHCGVVALTHLRQLIRGRAIDCEIPPGADAVPEVARCYVVGQDIGAWLVRQGWALPLDGAYARLAESAKEAKRGLWGTGRASRNGVICFSNC